MTTTSQQPHDTAAVAPARPARPTEFTLWKACAWAGPVFILALFVFWMLVARFFPPPGADWTAGQTAEFFAGHSVRIRIGMEGAMAFAMFYFVWSLAIAGVMRRMEGRERLLSSIQVIGGVGTAWITMGCALCWLTASFRAASRPPDDIQLLCDLGWMIFDITAMATMLQQVAIGIAILVDDRPTPLMPRWLGYLTFWLTATTFVVYLMPFFVTGPFAWQGLITLYVALAAFFTWAILVSRYTLVAIRRIEREERGVHAVPA
jgi:hypothetical protein